MEPDLWSTNSSVAPTASSNESASSAEWDIVHAVIPPYIFALCALGLPLNVFVLAVFLTHKDRLTVPEIYLSNLALADFVLLCGLPFWAMNILNHFNWPYGDALCKLVNSTIIINFYTSIYTLTMISIDRYLALVKTMKARWLRRTLYAKFISILLWVFGIFMSVLTMAHRKVMLIEEYHILACVLDYSHDSPWKLAHHVLLNVVGFVLPFLAIVFSSVNIINVLAKRRDGPGLHEVNDTKAMVLVYAVTLLFLVCWGPFQVFTFLDTLCDMGLLEENAWGHILDIGSQISAYLAFLNSTLNPLLYVFSGQYFRRKVTAIYRRHHRRGSDMTTYQRSVISTYLNRPEQIKPVNIYDAKGKK